MTSDLIRRLEKAFRDWDIKEIKRLNEIYWRLTNE